MDRNCINCKHSKKYFLNLAGKRLNDFYECNNICSPNHKLIMFEIDYCIFFEPKEELNENCEIY